MRSNLAHEKVSTTTSKSVNSSKRAKGSSKARSNARFAALQEEQDEESQMPVRSAGASRKTRKAHSAAKGDGLANASVVQVDIKSQAVDKLELD
jgi:hypothetical protein